MDIGGNDRSYTYDAQGRLKTASDLGNGTYSYTYGEDGLAIISSPLSQTKNGPIQETLQYSYDDMGNLESIRYSDLLARSLAYRESDNRLGSMTLANGDEIAYDYNAAGQLTTQTGTGVGTTTMTYTAEGAIKTVTDPSGTTTYSYDPQTGQLSRIDNSNGSSIAYTYDSVGRIKSQTERGRDNTAGFTTEYDYDAFGNLNWVKDPAGGVTTMTYDVANRMTQRNLPNGVVTTWAYDDLDRITSVTHRNGSTVLSSVTYDRDGLGQPTKITREDHSYVKLKYDEALRVTKESYFNAQNLLLEETEYVYDAAGKRIAKITAAGNQTYNYDKGYQLDSVTGSHPEDYAYDANGRMDLMQRDGQTLDLDHDVYDRLTRVKDQTGTTTNYVYDGQGRRISATAGGSTRTFLVAPVMSGGLESTDMMTDGAGNLLSNYVYAGGSSPFMRIDANGNPVYYLTDGMGSVIGLADQTGASAAKFAYDSFGNVRSQSGTLTNSNSAGGDFRFQGQWLESATGIYHFRARDYDSKTGTFLSRDPVDPNQQQPEAMNPYQAMYNNPYVYSDPTGMFTISELNASRAVREILNGISTYARDEAIEQVRSRVGQVAADAFFNALGRFLPIDSNIADKTLEVVNSFGSGSNFKPGTIFEKLLKEAVCEVFPTSIKDKIFFEYSISRSGFAVRDGYQCPQVSGGGSPKGSLRPDFIVTSGHPRRNRTDGPRSYLIGDIKLSLKTVIDDYFGDEFPARKPEQWTAIENYARKNGSYFVGFITLFDGGSRREEFQRALYQEALKKNTIVVLASILANQNTASS